MTSSKISSVAIFDSGIGGISVWRELIQKMPNQKMLYFADSANAPYGGRSPQFIIERADKISQFLIERGAKMIVVACNTATAAAIEHLRAKYRVPFVGMEPAVKPAATYTESGVIGVLATKGTLEGSLYHNTLKKFAPQLEVVEMVGEGLVGMVERGEFEGEEVESLLRKYLEPILERGADQLVLGCTHYPFLIESIKKIVGERIRIINPSPAVALRAVEIAKEIDLNAQNEERRGSLFFSSGESKLLQRVVRSISPEVEIDQFYEIDI